MPVDIAPPETEAMLPDPHGQAALLLVESLMFALVDRGVMSPQETAAAAEVARDAQIGMADAGRSSSITTHLIEAVLSSMEADVDSRADHEKSLI